MKITVQVHGGAEVESLFKNGSKRFQDVVEKRLQEFGDEVVAKFQADAHAGAFGTNRRGGPALIKTGTYVGSYRAEARGQEVGIGPTGMNRNMSNLALGELLEFGNGAGFPAIPHMRKMLVWAEKKAPGLGKKIVEDLLG